jgi:hypothetical protein
MSNATSVFRFPLVLLFSRKQVQSISTELFVTAFEFDFPSIWAVGLRCLNELIVHEAPPIALECVEASLEVVFSKFPRLTFNFETDRLTARLIEKLMIVEKRFRIPEGFLGTAASVFYTDSSLAIFDAALPICDLFFERFPWVFDKVFLLGFGERRVLPGFDRIFESKCGARILNDKIVDFFVGCPDERNAKLVIASAVATDTIDSTGCFIMNHLSECVCFLPVFVILLEMAKQSDQFARLASESLRGMVGVREVALLKGIEGNIDRGFLIACCGSEEIFAECESDVSNS